MSESRFYRVKGSVYVDIEDVLAYLDLDEDENYVPTDEDWYHCALELFENDEIYWSWSDLEPEK